MNLNMSANATPFIQKSISISTYFFIAEYVIPFFPLVCSILGLIGFIGNAFTFLQPELRCNSCCIYILWSSFVDIIHIAVSVFPDYLERKYNIRLVWSFSTNLCKLYYFLYNFLPQLATNFLLLSIMDRYACTCPLTSWIYRLNKLKIVPRMIGMMIIITCIFSIYAPLLGTDVPSFCGYREEKIYGILSILINGIIQPVVMLIFVLLTCQNIRQSRQRVGVVTGTNSNRIRNQFFVMTITQVLVTAMFSLQWMVIQSYILYSEDHITTADLLLTLAMLFDLGSRIYAFNNVKSFYFSMLTSKSYRQTLMKGLKRILPRQWRQ